MLKNKFTDIENVTKTLIKATTLSVLCLTSLPSFAQVELPPITVSGFNVPTGNWGQIGGPVDMFDHPSCFYYCDSSGEDDDYYHDEDEHDFNVACVGLESDIGPLSHEDVQSYQNVNGAIESAISGTAGILAAGLTSSLGAAPGASTAYGIVTTLIAEILQDSSNNFWCGKKITFRTEMCMGNDIRGYAEANDLPIISPFIHGGFTINYTDTISTDLSVCN